VYRDKLEHEVETYKADSTAQFKTMEELEDQKRQLAEEMEEIRMRFGGDLEDVAERLEVDLRTSAGLEGYRKNLGSELDTVRKKLVQERPYPEYDEGDAKRYSGGSGGDRGSQRYSGSGQYK